MSNIPITNFTSGELTPKIDSRVDIDKYASGCKHLENMIPLVYGIAERRPGTVKIFGPEMSRAYGSGIYEQSPTGTQKYGGIS